MLGSNPSRNLSPNHHRERKVIKHEQEEPSLQNANPVPKPTDAFCGRKKRGGGSAREKKRRRVTFANRDALGNNAGSIRFLTVKISSHDSELPPPR